MARFRATGYWQAAVLAALGSILLPAQARLEVGYTLLQAGAGTPLPVGTALFSFTSPDGVLVSQAGVGASEPILSGRVFVDETGTQTGIALVNPAAQPAAVTLVLRDSRGSEVDRRTLSLGAGEHLPRFINQLFSDVPPAFVGSLTFESDRELAAITLRQSLNSFSEPLYTTLPVVDLSAVPSGQALVFPQIAAGDGYSTQLVLLNTTSQTLRGRLSFTASDSTPLAVRLAGTTAASFTYELEPHGAYRAEFDREDGLGVGYAVLEPDAGSSAPAGSAIFRFRSRGLLVTEAGVAPIPETTSARIFVDNVATYTGVALANPARESATVTFTLLDRYGSSLAATSRTLAPRGHLAVFAHELFPALSGSFTGLLDISSSVATVPITLRLTVNARGDLVLTTLPVADRSSPPAALSTIFPQIAIGGGFSTRLVLIEPTGAAASSGSMDFRDSGGLPMSVPLGGASGSAFSYEVPAGGGRQFLPGNTSMPVSISVVDPSSGAPATEIVVNEGNTVRPPTLVVDAGGSVRDDFEVALSSLNPDVAAVDAVGRVRGKAAGFSTLFLSAGTAVTGCTVTVVRVESGAAGFEVTGVAQDLARRLYLANSGGHTVLLTQEIGKTPAVYAGIAGTAGLKNDARLQSLFRGPTFLAYHQASGTLFVSDSSNNVIRKVTPGAAGKVGTLAGTAVAGSRDGPLAEATFADPRGVALDDRGYLWVADSANHTVRRVNLVSGTVSTVAGRAGVPGWADGDKTEARFSSPDGIAIEPETLTARLDRERKGLPPPAVSAIVADTGNGVIRRVTESGQVETIRAGAAGQQPGFPHRRAAAGRAAEFAAPAGVYVDSVGGIYVSEPKRGRVSVILENGNVVPVGQAGTFSSPRGLVVTGTGAVVVADGAGAARQITYGSPRISGVSPGSIGNRGGERVTLTGENFAPETQVIIAGVQVPAPEITDTRTITFVSPPLPSGRATVTVQNRGGLAQKPISVDAVPLEALPAGSITTVAGGATFAGDGAEAAAARLSLPVGVAVDGSGNVYIAERDSHRIRRVDAGTGIVSTVAGSGRAAYSGDGGSALAADLNLPEAVAVDGAGNLFVADSGNYRIRRVSAASGVITTIAGGGDPADGLGDRLPARDAALSGVGAIAFDTAGDLYIADTGHNRVRRLSLGSGIIDTVAGTGRAGYDGDNVPATAASLDAPEGLALDDAGNLFIADVGNRRIRRVDARSGLIATAAGNGQPGFSGDGGPATAARLEPGGLALQAGGDLFIADRGNDRVRRLDAATGVISTVAGSGDTGFSGDGGPAVSAGLRFVHGLAVDSAGNLFIADAGNHRVRRVSAADQVISTFAGTAVAGYLGDGGPATSAYLNRPLAAVADAGGNVYIAESDNNRVRVVKAATRVIATYAGTGEETFGGEGGPAAQASFVAPAGLALDSAGNLFIAAAGNHRVLKVTASGGALSTVAGSGEEGYGGDNGLAEQAELSEPNGVALDADGNLFIADTANNRVRRVDAATRVITTVAGGGFTLGDNGPATTAALAQPRSVVVARNGALYIADTFNHRIRKVDASGTITTAAGTGSEGFSGDGGPATGAALSYPRAVALDAAGNLLIADLNCVVRRVDAGSGIIRTIAGTGETGFSGDNGPASAAALAFPFGLYVDSAGSLFISDTYNDRIRAVHGPIP